MFFNNAPGYREVTSITTKQAINMKKLINLIAGFFLIVSFSAQAEVDIFGQYQIINTEIASDGLSVLTVKVKLENLGDTALQNMELELMEPRFSMLYSRSDVLTITSLPINEITTLVWTFKAIMPIDHLPEDLQFLIFGESTDGNDKPVSISILAEAGILE